MGDELKYTEDNKDNHEVVVSVIEQCDSKCKQVNPKQGSVSFKSMMTIELMGLGRDGLLEQSRQGCRGQKAQGCVKDGDVT